jgi:hypothetical protein
LKIAEVVYSADVPQWLARPGRVLGVVAEFAGASF